MSAKPGLITCLIGIALAQPAVDDPAKKDLERMQGIWIMQALEINGKDVAADKLQGTVLIIKGDEYRTKVKAMEVPGFHLKLDPSKKPKALDMIQKAPDGSEKLIKGIYTFENDTFKICRGIAPEQARPDQFATWPDTNYFVVTWKKKGK